MAKVLYAEVFYVYYFKEKKNFFNISLVLIIFLNFGNNFFTFLTKFLLKSITLRLKFSFNNKNKASTDNKTVLNVINMLNFR
jgi:hypothetical protein